MNVCVAYVQRVQRSRNVLAAYVQRVSNVYLYATHTSDSFEHVQNF